MLEQRQHRTELVNFETDQQNLPNYEQCEEIKYKEQGPEDTWDHNKVSNIHTTGVLEGEEEV